MKKVILAFIFSLFLITESQAGGDPVKKEKNTSEVPRGTIGVPETGKVTVIPFSKIIRRQKKLTEVFFKSNIDFFSGQTPVLQNGYLSISETAGGAKFVRAKMWVGVSCNFQIQTYTCCQCQEGDLSIGWFMGMPFFIWNGQNIANSNCAGLPKPPSCQYLSDEW